jgi:hypothetical protein
MTIVGSPPAPARTSRAASAPSAAEGARAAGVVAGGPVLLDALEVLGPLSALGRWPERVPPGPLRTVGRWLTVAGALAPVVDHGLVA